MFLTWATNRHEWSLILISKPSTSLAQSCWWEYAKYSKIKVDEIRRISSSYRSTQNSRWKYYWCYNFPKALSKFNNHIWLSSTISPSQSIRIWRAQTSLCVQLMGTSIPSIKDCERSQHQHIVWKDPHKKRPTNWLYAFKNNTFKESLIGYLVMAWKDPYH